MTTQDPNRITAAEIRELFADLRAEIEELRAEVRQFKSGVATAAATQAGGTFKDFEMTEIILSYDDKGQPTYKGKGTPFTKFGVRIWPETLPSLNIDPASLKPGPNACKIRVKAEMINTTDESGQSRETPRKIVGLA